MANTSTVMVTTAGTMTAAQLAPVVQWALKGLPAATMPDTVPYTIAAWTIVVGHLGWQIVTNWLATRGVDVTPPADPAPTP